MKWPSSIMLIRHDTSEYNLLKERKKHDLEYAEFLRAWDKDPRSDVTRARAKVVQAKFSLNVGDARTKLADKEGTQAFRTGKELAKGEAPDVIFVSPYARTLATLDHLMRGWPALKQAQIFEEERVREQEHGAALLYNDWRVFHALNPDQFDLYGLQGSYYYQYPQGESVPNVRDRLRSFTTTLVRDWAEKNVLVVTHHLSILAFRANLERFGEARFLELDEKEKPINCGVTLYRGCKDKGKDGQLKLEYYNRKLY